MKQCYPCPPNPRERILEAIAIEQEQLARILTSLADKAEKSANWLPDTAPSEPFNVIVDKVRTLECVIAQEMSAAAMKEDAMKGLLRAIRTTDDNCLPCPSPSPCPSPGPSQCPSCPCVRFQVCKITHQCPWVCRVGFQCQDP